MMAADTNGGTLDGTLVAPFDLPDEVGLPVATALRSLGATSETIWQSSAGTDSGDVTELPETWTQATVVTPMDNDAWGAYAIDTGAPTGISSDAVLFTAEDPSGGLFAFYQTTVVDR